MSSECSDGGDDAFQPLVVVISGPSGVGKDVLIERMTCRGLRCHFTVTATTRQPRPGEQEGINHHFLSVNEFQRRIDDDELLEWARVYGNYYGVPKQQVRDALSAGNHVIIRVDVQGALRIQEMAPDALLIFIHAPDQEVLARRIRRRGVNSEDEIRTRLAAAASEAAQSRAFDHQVVNHEDRLEETVDDVIAIIHAEARKSPPRVVTV